MRKLKCLAICVPTTVIRGYGGAVTKVIGKCKVNLKVDLAEAEVEAVVVEDDTQGVEVMIGQPFIKDGITTIIKGDTVRLLHDDVLPLPELQQLPPVKMDLKAQRAVVIPSNEICYVPVSGTGDHLGD
ncbi:hypothetical protein NQ315_014753, partial [Exocentrus adspersus]